MSHFAQSQQQHVNPSPFKTPSKKDNRQQVFTEEGVSMVVDHELHYKNSDDEGDHDNSGSRSADDRRRKSMTTLSHLSNKDEHNDDHGRQVNHRHPQLHAHHVVGSPATSHKQLAHSTSSHNHLHLHHAHSSTDHHSHHHSGSGHHHHHNNHEKLSSLNTINGFWMLIDGIGLAIITAATILEGYELWIHFFHKYWEVNTTSLILWFLGRTFQIIGLLFLIGHASSFQVFHEIEQFGMLMLTIGPMVNMAACYTFALASDPDHLFQKQWFSTETMELVGILILDVSLIDMEEIHVLTAELVGFVCLCCAAGLTMEFQPVFHPLPSIPASYTKIVAQTAVTAATTALHRMLPQHGSGDISSSGSAGGSAHAGDLSDLLQSADAPVFALNHRPSSVLSSSLPDGGRLDALTASTGDWSTWWTWWVPHQVTWRLDTVHMSECCGLILLMCVAYGQYRMKLHKHQLLHATDPPAAHPASQSSYSSKDASAAAASIAVALNV